MFFWHDRRDLPSGALERCFTDSRDGVGEAPFSAFNLARHVGDDDADVVRNRAALGEALGGVPIAWMDQVHGIHVAEVTHADLAELRTADAMVTRAQDLALAVMVADCTPVLLDGGSVLGVAHAGRPGMMAGVVPATVAAMRDLGAAEITATVGPSVCGRCYEVPLEMREAARGLHPASAAVSWTGTHAVDVAAGVVEQLRALEVGIEWIPGCTRESERLYSYRRDGRTGRFAGVIVRHSASQEALG